MLLMKHYGISNIHGGDYASKTPPKVLNEFFGKRSVNIEGEMERFHEKIEHEEAED